MLGCTLAGSWDQKWSWGREPGCGCAKQRLQCDTDARPLCPLLKPLPTPPCSCTLEPQATAWISTLEPTDTNSGPSPAFLSRLSSLRPWLLPVRHRTVTGPSHQGEMLERKGGHSCQGLLLTGDSVCREQALWPYSCYVRGRLASTISSLSWLFPWPGHGDRGH